MKKIFLFIFLVSNCFAQEAFNFDVNEISTNLESPVFALFPSQLNKRFIYADKTGKINWYDLNSKTSSEILTIDGANEIAIITFALDPEYSSNSKIYIGFYDKKEDSKDLVIQQYENLDGDGYVMEKEILRLLDHSKIDKNFSIAFDFDKNLLIALPDGSKKFSENNNSMALGSLWGKVLRYEQIEDKFIAPLENPFVLQKIKNKEIYALGFREPSSLIVDNISKKIFATDVGENTYQEFNLLLAGKKYGWPIFEGSSCLKMQLECKNLNSEVPLYLYSFKTGKSIRASNVYYSSKYEDLKGYSLIHDSKKNFMTALKLDGELSKKKVTLSLNKSLEKFLEKSTFAQVFFNTEGRIFALSQDSLSELIYASNKAKKSSVEQLAITEMDSSRGSVKKANIKEDSVKTAIKNGL